MQDKVYCYPESDVLINRLNITDSRALFEAEKELTYIRLKELQANPIEGNFDFNHLKEIHRYIFQDLYDWAGKERTVEIGKGNLFCTTACIQDYSRSVFNKYFHQCYANKDNFTNFISVFSANYGDLNALHPFREGNGRAQREFARLVCLECGYDFDLSATSHAEMLAASKLSFDKGDNSSFEKIFAQAISSANDKVKRNKDSLSILTSDDMAIDVGDNYDYYDYTNASEINAYNIIYQEKISRMDVETEQKNN